MDETRSIGELVCKVGPLSIYYEARACCPLDGEEYTENRYPLRIDPAWLEEGNVVGVELEPPYYAVETGNRLDEIESFVEIASHPHNENEVEVLVMEPDSTPEESSHVPILHVRCKEV